MITAQCSVHSVNKKKNPESASSLHAQKHAGKNPLHVGVRR